MARLDFPAAGDALWEIYDACGIRPEYLVPILFRESSLDPTATNGYAHGISQVSTSFLTNAHIAVADYITWPASQQLRRITKAYMMSCVARYGDIKSGVRCYQVNFLPNSARLGSDLDMVLAVRGSSFYNDNSGLDWNGDGKITVGDLACVLHTLLTGKTAPHASDEAKRGAAAASAVIQDTLARTYDCRPSETLKDPIYGDDYPAPYLAGGFASMALDVAEMIGKGLTRIVRRK